ncbi:hypothetical protein BSL78_13779 [Apostichopus japonicus]|uniref:Reverse transcriptase domain-containing protein n=1 Tax=Stichopus japonicus TaxID=307972 RepID=A0A2G8KMV9_STIJA|nr:hypothetical protein BSL78_13779 [Apostichopus japonicus]
MQKSSAILSIFQLQVTHQPALGTLPPGLQREWNRVLHSTSIRLINILTKHCQSSLDSLNDDILRLKLELQSCCTDDEWTHADLRLLSKGLNFCPTPPAFASGTDQDLTHFFRRIRLREFFLDDPPTEREPFCKKSSWMPPKNRVPVLEAYTQVVSSETNQSNSPLRRTHDNLPRDERTALSSLMSRSDIIIKPADKDFLRKLEDIKNQIPVQPSSVLSTTSLYTNIPHAEGIAATCAALSKKVHPCPPISDIKALMQQVLTKNNFTFMDKHYLQRHGTAMGTRMSFLLACLYLQSSLEERMLSTATCRPLIRWRYFDDIFFVWTSDEDSLLTFINHINSFHSTIKFTSDYSHQQVNFLDVTVRKEHGSLSTDLYTKPTDTHQYLLLSCPRHCKSGIAYSQALRLRRICSNNSSFIRHTDALEKHLIAGAIVPEGCVKPFRESAPFPDHLLWQ